MLSKPATPLRLFIALLVLIFLTESALMVALEYLIHEEETPLWVAIVIDASLLTIFTSIFVWWLFMRPLNSALAGEAARAKAVTDAAVEGIIVINERGVIETFNPSAVRMFGYQAGEAIGKNVSMLMPEPHARRHDSYIARYILTGETRVIGSPREVMALRNDGSKFPIELNIAEIRIGSKRCFTGVIRDITERKHADAHILHLAHHDVLTDLPNRTLFYDRLRQAISIGIALYPHDAGQPDALVKAADTAMYDAKREKNTYRFAG